VRVLLLADTHGTLDERIAERARGSDVVVHAGDVGSATVLEALRARCPRVIAVRGNNDVSSKWAASERTAMEALGEQAQVDLPGGGLVVVHGDRFPAAQRHRRLRDAFPQARAVVYGHSHRLCIDESERPWVLNPGAAGRARTFGGPSCLELVATVRRWRVEALRFPL